MKKSFIAIFSAAAMAVSGIGSTIAYGSVFADINTVPWAGAATYIDEAYNLGLMAGYVENGQRYCKPRNNVTYCEAAQLMYAIMSSYSGTSVSPSVVSKWTNVMASKNIPSWAYNAVAYALENSILSQNDIGIFMASASSQNNARREDVAVIFGKALSKVYTLASNPTISYADKAKVATTSIPYIELLNRLNIMVGDSNNNFNPKVNINRAEMSVLVSKTYNTLKKGGTTTPSTPSGTITQYSGKVTEKTSSGSGYKITVTSNGKTNTFTTTSSTAVMNGSSTSTVDKINTGSQIVAVCNGGVATTIIVMSQGEDTAASTKKGEINSITTTKIALKSGSKTSDYYIKNDDIPVTIDGSSSSLSSLVSKFKGGTNYSATISLDSDDEVIKIAASKGAGDDEYDEDAIVKLSSSKVTLNNGDVLNFPDDEDDVTIKLDGKTVDYDELEEKYDDLDDDEQMVVKDYDLDRHDELESIKIEIEDKEESSSSSSATKGVISAISESKGIKLEGSSSYTKFADEDDITKLELDDDSYDGDELDDFVEAIEDKLDKDKSVYVELTVKSKEITKAIATVCEAEEGDIEKISSSKITLDGDDYDYSSSASVDVKDGSSKISKMSNLKKAVEDDDKVIEATIILNDDDEVITVTGYVKEIGETEIKKFEFDEDNDPEDCYITLDNNSSSTKYYFDDSFDMVDIEDAYDDYDDGDGKTDVELELNDEGKIEKITLS